MTFPAWQKLGKEINALTSCTMSAASLPVVVKVVCSVEGQSKSTAMDKWLLELELAMCYMTVSFEWFFVSDAA